MTEKLRNRIIGAIIILVILSPFLVNLGFMLRPNYHIWPEITRCRGCEKEIWAWQDYERRTVPAGSASNPGATNGIIYVSASFSSLYHKECPVRPERLGMRIE